MSIRNCLGWVDILMCGSAHLQCTWKVGLEFIKNRAEANARSATLTFKEELELCDLVGTSRI